MTPESVPVVAVQHNDHEEDVEAAIAKEPITEASHTSTTIQTPVTTGPPIVIPPSTKAPKQTLQAVYAAGKYKAGLTLPILCVQSFMAGIYIAFAGHLYLVVGGGVLGSSLFPGGLIAVVLTSAELYTGDALIFVASVLGGQVAFRSLLRNWTVSWCCNFVGSLVWAYFLAYLSGALHDSHAVELAIQVAEKKALNELSHIFIKAIGANFMYVLIYVKTNWSVCFVSLVFNYSLLTGIFLFKFMLQGLRGRLARYLCGRSGRQSLGSLVSYRCLCHDGIWSRRGQYVFYSHRNDVWCQCQRRTNVCCLGHGHLGKCCRRWYWCRYDLLVCLWFARQFWRIDFQNSTKHEWCQDTCGLGWSSILSSASSQ